MNTLTAVGKQALRARAHLLKPVVIVAEKGLTENVMKAIDQALFDHELIKVKILAADKTELSELITQIETDLKTELVQHIGHVAVFFRKSSKSKKA
jgi:RNA-binding protein